MYKSAFCFNMFILQVILNMQKLIFEHVIQIQHWWKALEWKKGDKGEARQLRHTQGFKIWITTRSSSRLAMWCTAALKFFSKSTQNIHYFWNLLYATLYNYWHEVVSRIWIQSRCGFVWGALHGTVAVTAVVVGVVLPVSYTPPRILMESIRSPDKVLILLMDSW